MKQMCTFLLIRIKIRNDNARNRRRKSPTQPSTYLYTFHGAECGRARLIACTKIFRQSWGALGIEKKCIAHVISFFDSFSSCFFSLSLLFWKKLSLFPLCVCVLWVHAQHHARDSTPHEARSRHERKNHKKDNINNRDVLVVSPNDGL